MEETTRDELHQDMRIMDDHERKVMRRKQKENEMIEHDRMIAEQNLQKYKCHKEIVAAKITGIYRYEAYDKERGNTYHSVLKVEFSNYAFPSFDDTIHVPEDYIARHRPEIGGYYVQYADGYQSYSPAKAFEEGYTPING